jgi:hypothetical protein
MAISISQEKILQEKYMSHVDSQPLWYRPFEASKVCPAMKLPYLSGGAKVYFETTTFSKRSTLTCRCNFDSSAARAYPCYSPCSDEGSKFNSELHKKECLKWPCCTYLICNEQHQFSLVIQSPSHKSHDLKGLTFPDNCKRNNTFTQVELKAFTRLSP